MPSPFSKSSQKNPTHSKLDFHILTCSAKWIVKFNTKYVKIWKGLILWKIGIAILDGPKINEDGWNIKQAIPKSSMVLSCHPLMFEQTIKIFALFQLLYDESKQGV